MKRSVELWCRLWNPHTGAFRAAPACNNAVTALAFAPDASALVMGTHAGRLSLRKARTPDTPSAEPLKTDGAIKLWPIRLD
jgi:hypothetical protein